MQAFISAADLPWQHMATGIKRQVLGHGTDLMLVRVEFEAGAVGALHHHPHRQGTYVVAGSFEVTVGDDNRTLSAGDCFYAATEVPHAVRAIGAGTLLDVFTPIREDFLKPNV